MVKVCLFLILFTQFGSNLFGQAFGGKNARWVFDYRGGATNGITIINYIKDTVIGQRIVSIYMKRGIRKFNNDTINVALEPIYLHAKNGIIEFSMNARNFDTLYNYKAEIGQSWIIYRHDPYISDSIKVTILDTFRTIISNQNIFTQQIEWTDYYSFGTQTFVDTVYDHIGALWTYMFPFDGKDVAIDGGEGGVIRCFKNDFLGVVEFHSKYIKYFNYDCDNLTSVSTPKTGEKFFSVSPNPVINELYVESEHPDIAPLKIVDITGHVLFTADILPGMNTLDVKWMPSGYYMVIIDGKMVGKVVK